MRSKSIVSLASIALLSNSVQAGFNSYTTIDKIDGWIIERKFDSNNNKYQCRASVKKSGGWFSDRIRLDSKNNIIIPDNVMSTNRLAFGVVKKVKDSLIDCQSNFLYKI